MHSLKRIIPVVIIASILLFSCGQEQGRSAAPGSRLDFANRKSSGSITRDIMPSLEKKARKKDSPRPFLPPAMETAEKRLLEYRVSITMEVTNLHTMRGELLTIIPRYGFLLSSSWNSRHSRPSMSLSLKVRSDRLLPALREITAVGTLISERITVTDHTESMFISSVRASRAALRIRRTNPNTGNDNRIRNYRADEDSQDNEKISKWRINDRIRWATVYVYVRGPEKPPVIRVPSFQRTLVEAVNSLLAFLVELLPVLPLLLAGFWIWRKRGKIRAFFKKGGSHEQPQNEK